MNPSPIIENWLDDFRLVIPSQPNAAVRVVIVETIDTMFAALSYLQSNKGGIKKMCQLLTASVLSSNDFYSLITNSHKEATCF